MASYLRDLERLLRAAGGTPVRQGRGDHVIWHSSVMKRNFTVDQRCRSKHTANATLKQAGLLKAF